MRHTMKLLKDKKFRKKTVARLLGLHDADKLDEDRINCLQCNIRGLTFSQHNAVIA